LPKADCANGFPGSGDGTRTAIDLATSQSVGVEMDASLISDVDVRQTGDCLGHQDERGVHHEQD